MNTFLPPQALNLDIVTQNYFLLEVAGDHGERPGLTKMTTKI